MRDFNSVALIGLEPIQTEPESGVLPLHHKAILRARKNTFFSFMRALLIIFF